MRERIKSGHIDLELVGRSVGKLFGISIGSDLFSDICIKFESGDDG